MSNYRITSRGLVIRKGKLLLNEFNNGEYYNIPGGGVEVNETLRETVKRELLEESGYTVESKELVYVTEYNPIRDDYSYGKRGALVYVFRCEIDETVPRMEATVIDSDPTGNSRSTGCKWVPLEDLTKINLVPKIGHILEEALRKETMDLVFLEDIH
jgi:8-oxo-dGTP diphosphatase